MKSLTNSISESIFTTNAGTAQVATGALIPLKGGNMILRDTGGCQIGIIYPDKSGANITIPRKICKKLEDSSDEYAAICIIDNHKHDDITLTFEADVAFEHNLDICSTMDKGSTLTIAGGDITSRGEMALYGEEGCFRIMGMDWDFNAYPTINDIVGLDDGDIFDIAVPDTQSNFGFNVILDSKIKYSLASFIGQGNTITQRKGHLGKDDFELFRITLR